MRKLIEKEKRLALMSDANMATVESCLARLFLCKRLVSSNNSL